MEQARKAAQKEKIDSTNGKPQQDVTKQSGCFAPKSLTAHTAFAVAHGSGVCTRTDEPMLRKIYSDQLLPFALDNED